MCEIVRVIMKKIALRKRHKSEPRAELELKLLEKLDELLVASDQFEALRAKLAKNLEEASDVAELKAAVKSMLDARSKATVLHVELNEMLLAGKSLLSAKEQAELTEKMCCGYKHLRTFLNELVHRD